MGVTVLRQAVRLAFAGAGLVLLVAGPTVSIVSDWGVGVTFVLAAAGVVALAIAYLMARTQQA